ncbi:cytochrome c oxidase subunit 8A, mitochondrial-like [Mastacembelus armatus]|uniref:Cytochrome c oxidase subunit 8A, mitochondrial-like n=1 Tax=Mastacembelus armatus TaxID=205130 RepID=A0A3Q3MW54_9TELE|nr:cytochrome c oxidase subunit 8A, mitochondrial-like [Mastacembelus armatus]
MPGFLRTIASRLTPALRGHTITQRATLYSKPGKENVGLVETFIGMTLFSLVILGPSGWILSHLEDYKKRE